MQQSVTRFSEMCYVLVSARALYLCMVIRHDPLVNVTQEEEDAAIHLANRHGRKRFSTNEQSESRVNRLRSITEDQRIGQQSENNDFPITMLLLIDLFYDAIHNPIYKRVDEGWIQSTS